MSVHPPDAGLRFEPIVSLTTACLVGVEAIGPWVLRGACDHAAEWNAAVVMSIDASPEEFCDDFLGVVRDALLGSGVAAAAVCVEVTETTLIRDLEMTTRVLDGLRELGVCVRIDRFGSGYSSLESLTTMAVGSIKIPPSFITDVGASAKDTAMVASVIGLAHAMGLEVIVEGVETADQFVRLRELGCDAAQGPYVGLPLSAGEMRAQVADAEAGRPFALGSSGPQQPHTTSVVMVVDDNGGDRFLATASLLAAGFKVEAAVNGRDALAAAQRLRPDCVLLDVQLPDMSGIDVCRALRAHPDTCECTVVMLSNHDHGALKAESFLVGADDYVVKPSSPVELVARVRSTMRRRAAASAASPGCADPALLEMLHAVRDRSLRAVVPELEPLSTRQLEILRRLLDGDRVPAIARDLYVSASTVRNHLSSTFRKLGVHSQEELLALLRTIQATHDDAPIAEPRATAPTVQPRVLPAPQSADRA